MNMFRPSLFLRPFARLLSQVLSRYPRVRSALRGWFLALPPWWRGGQLVHDHFVLISKFSPQRFALIGANDGVTDDHVFFFVRRHQWKGVAIEPVPVYYEQLSRNLKPWPVCCMNVAIHDSASQVPFYFLEDSVTASLPAYAKGVGSFNRAQVESLSAEIPSLRERMSEIQVSCMKLTTALETAGLEDVDVIVIDTEGYDGNIVRQIDFERWSPHTIVFEHKLLSPQDLASALNLLRSQGFSCKQDQADVLAYRLPQRQSPTRANN